jgi:hypothetical protein
VTNQLETPADKKLDVIPAAPCFPRHRRRLPAEKSSQIPK